MIDSKSIIKKFEFLSLYKKDENWQEELYQMAFWKKFSPIYDIADIRQSNILVSFVVFAFSGHSNMIHLHRDRIENKKEILIELGAPMEELESGIWYEIIYNKSFDNQFDDDEDSFIKKYRKVVTSFVSWQLDSKFKLWMSLREFASVNTTYANEPCPERMQVASKLGAITIDTPDSVRATTTARKANILQQCMEIESDATALEQKIKSKYVNLDTIIEQEFNSTNVDFDYDIRRVEDRLKMRQNNL